MVSKSKPAIPVLLHPSLVSFAFTVFDQFWEEKQNKTPVKALLSMFQFLINIFGLDENVKKCSEHDVVRLILEKFSFVLDSSEFPECSRLCLELFSLSSSIYVSPAAIHIVINKLTNKKAPVDAISRFVLTLTRLIGLPPHTPVIQKIAD